MAQYFTIHPVNPQPRLIRQAAQIVRDGGVIVYPTDSCYALGCHIGDIATYAKVDNQQYRLLKAATQGCYAFILEATREVPKRLQHPSRRTIGLRIPDHPVVGALLDELNEPLLSSSLMLPGEDVALNDPEEIRALLEQQGDLILDAGACGVEPTTVVNLTGAAPEITRVGKGDTALFGV